MLDSLSPSHLWSTSWSGILHCALHTFLHPVIVFFRNTYTCNCNLFCCSADVISSNDLILVSHLCLLMCHLISSFSLQARSHFHATYYFTHNCCTVSVTLSMIYPYWSAVVPTVWIYSNQFEFCLQSSISISIYTQYVVHVLVKGHKSRVNLMVNPNPCLEQLALNKPLSMTTFSISTLSLCLSTLTTLSTHSSATNIPTP